MLAAKEEGDAVKKREDTHKMAEANRAFAHFLGRNQISERPTLSLYEKDPRWPARPARVFFLCAPRNSSQIFDFAGPGSY